VLDLRVLLGQHVARYPYQRALSREGAVRLDLDGNPVGAVTEEQRERALRPLRRSGPGTWPSVKSARRRRRRRRRAMANDESILPSPRLRDLARGVQLLLPDRGDPHQFHEKKSEIVADLRALARGLDGHRPIEFHMEADQRWLVVVTVPPDLGRLPPISTNCLFCRRRRASQGRRQRLKLPNRTLFAWAGLE
jgi:ProQ/FINO family